MELEPDIRTEQEKQTNKGLALTCMVCGKPATSRTGYLPTSRQPEECSNKTLSAEALGVPILVPYPEDGYIQVELDIAALQTTNPETFAKLFESLTASMKFMVLSVFKGKESPELLFILRKGRDRLGLICGMCLADHLNKMKELLLDEKPT